MKFTPNNTPRTLCNESDAADCGVTINRAETTHCKESERYPERCQGPFCDSPVPQRKKHAPAKLYCSPNCAQQASIIKRAAELLTPLGKDKAWELLSR